jgi:hypothetical protein
MRDRKRSKKGNKPESWEDREARVLKIKKESEALGGTVRDINARTGAQLTTEDFEALLKRPESERLFIGELLAGKFPLFRAAKSGMIFYPSFPSKIHEKDKDYQDDFDLTPFYDWPQWMQNLDSEHGSVEVWQDPENPLDKPWVFWWGGTVHDGIWMGDERTLWMGGLWRDGIIMGGHFWNCTVLSGEKRGGEIHSGIWHGGLHRAGSFGGLWLGGTWLGGKFYGFKERSMEPPDFISGLHSWPRY